MKIFDRLKTGLSITLRSVSVLRDYPKLVLFPLIAGVAGLSFLGVLGASLFVVNETSELVLYAALFAFYFGSTFVASFFTAGLVYCADSVFHGKTPRIRSGLRAAAGTVGPILIWSVISATVGVVLQMVTDDDTALSTVVTAVIGAAWSVITYFIVPVIVFEDTGVFEMFARSKETVVQTWGESLGAIAGVSFVSILFGLVGAIPGVVIFVVSESGSPIGLFVLVAGVLIALVIEQTLVGIAKTALYLYATEDELPDYFDGIDLGDDGRSGRGQSDRTLGGNI